MNPANQPFPPDFCSLKILLAVFLLTEWLAFLLTFAANQPLASFLTDFFLRSLFALWIALPSMALLCGLRPVMLRLNPLPAGGLAFFIIQIITLFISYLAINLWPNLSLIFPTLTETETLRFYIRTFGISALVSLAFLRYLYVLSHWQHSIEASANAKLHALQARMRPHFLFNSLNSIASLIRFDPPLAETLVEDLADLIRASLNLDDKLLVTLAEELKLVELYLAIEQQRLDARLQVHWLLDDVPKTVLLPPLSLQPLVENAVYYGVEPNPAGGDITISGQVIKHKLLIYIKNSLNPENEPHRQGNQMALANLAARLHGCFDGAAALRVEKTPSYYQVTLEIPWRP